MAQSTDIDRAAKRGLVTQAMPIVFVVLWSTGYIGSKFGAPYAEPFTFLTARFVLVSALMGLAIVVTRARWPSDRTALLHSVVIGMMMHGLYLGGVFWAIANGMPAGVSALIVALQPIATAIGAALVLGERLSTRTLIALVVGIVGVALVLGPRFTLSASGITPATIAAVVVAMIAISASTIYQKRVVTDLNLWVGGLCQYMGGFLVCLPLAAFTETMVIDWSPIFVLTLAWLVVVLSIGAVSLLMLMIRAGAVSRVATLFFLVPASTALMGFLFFGETLTIVQIAGMVVTSVAVAIAMRAKA
ncbi:DMT family transporter [Amorphus sp. 3PC139-8]|uniref:DMT family transporter n=1 Tax=Amorphus sp. 3PC139-8 TaxID=2735676 RepID=UPI00345CC573